jgi:signal transduction histidine kinase
LVSLQNQFVTTVSHEFRTPLTGILTSCELIEVYSQKMTQEKLNNEISKIKTRVEDLTKLMNNFIVQSSKLGLKERFNPQLHEFNNFVERILEDNKNSLQNKNIQLTYTVDSESNYVLIDESMVRHSIQNVLSNAIMYSPSNSEITITIQSINDNITLMVSDQGIGIPSDEIDSIFSPFFRATNTSNISGSGLGLSLAKEFIEINNGNISVDSSIGKGTTVTITLESKTQSVLKA